MEHEQKYIDMAIAYEKQITDYKIAILSVLRGCYVMVNDKQLGKCRMIKEEDYQKLIQVLK